MCVCVFRLYYEAGEMMGDDESRAREQQRERERASNIILHWRVEETTTHASNYDLALSLHPQSSSLTVTIYIIFFPVFGTEIMKNR